MFDRDLFSSFSTQELETALDQEGKIQLCENFFDERQADQYFLKLKEDLPWSQDEIILYGKKVKIPRLQCFFSDPAVEYSYSGLKLSSLTWTEELSQIKDMVEGICAQSFNACLCNLYRDGHDYASWHSDDEKELGKNPTIASISLGASRKFVLKHKTNKGIEKREFILKHNSLMIMSGQLQHKWKHQLNKTQKQIDARINLTFRKIKNN